MVVEYEFLNVAGIKLEIFQMLKAKSSQNETILKYKGKDKCYALNIFFLLTYKTKDTDSWNADTLNPETHWVGLLYLQIESPSSLRLFYLCSYLQQGLFVIYFILNLKRMDCLKWILMGHSRQSNRNEDVQWELDASTWNSCFVHRIGYLAVLSSS